jgi:hypothetical protein
MKDVPAADDDIRRFLQSDVPPGRTPEMRRWIEQCRGLGDGAVPVCIELLRSGTEAEQYAALICMREHGYEAWGEDYGAVFHYRYRPIGDGAWTIVDPIIKPE